MMEVGDKVKAFQCIDNAVPIDADFMGKVGTLVKIGDGMSVETMCHVAYGDGGCGAFWPEELELA